MVATRTMNFFDIDSKELAKLTAKAIFYASIQSSLGSVEMSSKFSVMNFSKDQETLQRAADALKSYIIIAVIWTAGTVLALYASHGKAGAVMGVLSNAIMMAWIVVSYDRAFKSAAKQNGLNVPTVFNATEWKAMIAIAVVSAAAGFIYSSKD